MPRARTGTAPRSTILTVALATAVALVLAGCGSGGGGGSADCDTSRGTLVVGLVAPLSGELASVGLGMKNSADLAVKEANDRCAVPGYHLAIQSQDDRADPRTGAAAARTLAADPSLIGVLGPFNSSVALEMQRVLADASVVEISPGTTAVQLTRGSNPVTAPLRQYQTFFRTVATDAVQGPAAAAFMAEQAGRKRVAVVSDGKTYGEGIASEFSKQLATVGGAVVSRTQLPPAAPPQAAVGAITRSRPDAVFYGGEYPGAGPLSRALGAAGLDVPLMGGDGIVNPGYISAGGREGDLGTSVGAPPETVPSARGFVDAYKRAGYPEDFGSYGAFTYDAAMVLVSSAAGVIGDGTWGPASRPAMTRAVQNHSGDGVTGPISFDRYGDVVTDTVTVYRVAGGRWTAVRPAA